MTINKSLFDYIKKSPSPFHAVATTADILEKSGYTRLYEGDSWNLTEGGKYYVTRGGTSIIAFRVPKADFRGFMISAAHSDSPTFKIKENSEIKGGAYVKLSTEKYGGMLFSTWMDRPLGIAGRVAVKENGAVKLRLVDLGPACAIIPNLAIHMNRSANDGVKYNPAVDMIPVWGCGDDSESFKAKVATVAGADESDILSADLMLYCSDECREFGGIISAPRLDDLQCAYASLEAFISSSDGDCAPVYCLFDNEEVGSLSKQGADSTFLYDVLDRISLDFGSTESFKRRVSQSFLISCDNAHASHPNHPEYSDPNHAVQLNKGVVIKYNANQKYTSDGVSIAILKLLCEEAGIPWQIYANRADLPGGSTLGNISNSHVSLNSVDVGLPQLAMHSAYESAGSRDTESMVGLLKVFFSRSLVLNDGLGAKLL